MRRAASARGVEGYREADARTWPDHRGRPAPDALYDVAPDPAIGEVRTAWSNRTRGGFRPRSRRERVQLALGVVGLGVLPTFALGAGATWALVQIGSRPPIWAPYLVASAIVLAAIAWWARVRPACSYVGDEGFAEHVRTPFARRDHVVLFADVGSMTLVERATVVNGIYQGTEWERHLRAPDGRVLLTLSGRRYDRGPWSAIESPPWELARAVESRWNEIRWARALEELRERGELRVRAAQATLVVGRDALAIVRGAEEQRLAREDVASIAIADGVLTIRRVDARSGLLRSSGIDSFPVEQIEDVAVLLRALRTVAGFAVAG